MAKLDLEPPPDTSQSLSMHALRLWINENHEPTDRRTWYDTNSGFELIIRMRPKTEVQENG